MIKCLGIKLFWIKAIDETNACSYKQPCNFLITLRMMIFYDVCKTIDNFWSVRLIDKEKVGTFKMEIARTLVRVFLNSKFKDTTDMIKTSKVGWYLRLRNILGNEIFKYSTIL